MDYSLDDIELMISDLPMRGGTYTLDEKFNPQRRRIKAGGLHLPTFTRVRKIINSLIIHFQNNPINSEDNWTNSNIPYFLWEIRKFSGDKDVERLMQILNVERLRSGRTN